MPIASRTPEGDPFSCRVCGTVDRIEPSVVTGDAVCPRCGSYVARLLTRFDEHFPGAARPITLDTPLAELAAHGDSLDLVELVMELEEELGAAPASEEWAGETVEDLIRYLTQRPDGRESL